MNLLTAKIVKSSEMRIPAATIPQRIQRAMASAPLKFISGRLWCSP
ncbi:MAG: hypothetical protein LIO77_04455 [Rikenellaceae bacterium]|nr:hypothetical protein [Rikenellaceae bacterium]